MEFKKDEVTFAAYDELQKMIKLLTVCDSIFEKKLQKKLQKGKEKWNY